MGQIDEVAQDVTLRLSNNTLVQVERPEFLELATEDGNAITDQSLFISDKFVVGQHVVCTKSNLRRGKWILGEYNPDIEPHGIIVDVRTNYLTVNWVAQRYQGPGTPAVQFQIQPSTELYPDDDHVVVLANISDSTSYQIGDRVRFLDRQVETGLYGGQRMDRRDLGGFDGNVWMVVGTETFVDVDWQDGTTSTQIPAKDLRMYLNVDEYEGWPACSLDLSLLFLVSDDQGDYVSQTNPNGETRFGIIQNVAPEERIARVRFFDEGTLLPAIEEISLYELNAHPILQYSLGDHVLIQPKLLPPAGIVVEVVSMTAGFVEHIVRRMRESEDGNVPGHQRTTTAITEQVDWMGEITRINVDGTVKVRLARETEPPPDWGGERYVVVKSEELIVFEGDEEDEEGDVEMIEGEDFEDEQDETDDEDDWEDASEGDEDDEDEIPQASLDGMSDVEPITEEGIDINGNMDDLVEMPAVPGLVAVPETNASQLDKAKCVGFDILETVPDDHPFKIGIPVRTSPEFLSRIRKEHRILQTSLPGKSTQHCTKTMLIS